MKFQPDRLSFAITGYGPDWIAVADERIAHSVVLHSDGTRAPWPCERFDLLTAAHFEPLALARPELVLFGSGQRLRFARPELLRPLVEAGIGVECMDTPAACRTWNILASEGRRVTAALLLEPADVTNGIK
jgi:uncharacterized protein